MLQKSRISVFSMALIASVQMAFYSPLSVYESSAATNDIIPPLFFGLHAMGYGSSGYPVPYQPWGLIRTWDHWGNGNISWAGLEPSRGNFNWTAMDATVNAITNQNVAILHCFGWPPSWATTCSTCAPTNILDWDNFITAFVNRYHTRIKYLEVWNESMAGEGFYTGTTAQLVQLAQHLYTITKSIDPTVTVLTPDATGGKANMTQFYSDYFAAGGGAYADVIAFHGYCSMAGASQITYPEEILGIVGNLKAAMNAYGQGSKPIFCTEGDWGTEGSGGNCPTTDDCVAFMARHYLLQWSLGVSSYAWYDWENNNGSWQWGQMWDPTSGLNAAGIAYQQLYNWMVGAMMSQPYAVQGSVYTCGFSRPGGYQALAVWDTNRASTSTFTVPNGYVQYRDLAGNLYSISGTTVTIGIKPILLENSNAVTSNSVTPVFSGLTSHTNTYGATVTLTGTVSTNGSYLPSGTTVSVTINGSQQNTTISDLTGDFSINYNTAGLPASGSPYAVTYASAAAFGFNAATNTSTTLTVNQLPVVLTGTMVYSGTATAPAAILSVANLVGSDSVTLSGSVGLAGAAVGAEAITSFGALSLGGAAAPNYTLAGASGTVTILSTNAVTPIFSGLTSHTNTYGASVTLTGRVSSSGTYPASGTVITVSVNGSPQATNIYDSTGDFSINYNTLGLPASATPYTVTYTSAAAVGFNAATDTSTTLTITAGGGATGITYLVGTFNSSADTTPWVNAGQSATITSSFVADAPPGQVLSSGALGWTGTYDSTGHNFGGLQLTFSSTNLTAGGYTDFQFDVKVLNNSFDRYGQIQSLQPVLGITSSLNWSPSSVQPQLVNVSTNNGWRHIDIPLTAFPGSLSDVRRVFLLMYDGNYLTATSVQLAFDNIMFTAPGAANTNIALTPVFSGLASHTNAYGSSVTLTGTVSTNGAYPASGTVITVTINGTPQTTTLSDSTGDFSINYNTTGLPASATPYTVAYSSPAGGGFNAATDTSTTLTIVARPEMGGISVSGTQFIFSYPTVVGQTYQLQYCTDLTSGLWLPAGSSVLGTGALVWTTNNVSSMQQQFFRLSITP